MQHRIDLRPFTTDDHELDPRRSVRSNFFETIKKCSKQGRVNPDQLMASEQSSHIQLSPRMVVADVVFELGREHDEDPVMEGPGSGQ
jgi:hypothetical protein